MAAVPFHEYPHRGELMKRAPEIMDAVLRRSAGKGKDWEGRMDTEAAIEIAQALADGQDIPGLQATVLNNSHLVIYSLGSPWYACTKVWFIEQFFIRIGRGPVACALHDLEDLARALGASTIVMATSLAANDSALGRLYAQHGYSGQSTQHFKEL
ncbi:MAG: hypothetical protein V4451_16975 [Pseudomonadota bacterium]